MSDDTGLFKARETKDTSLTIKLTVRQKEWIRNAAQAKGLNNSQYILHIVGLEYERQPKYRPISDFFDIDVSGFDDDYD